MTENSNTSDDRLTASSNQEPGMPHHLHRQIDKLKRAILKVGALVEDALQNAITSINERDIALAEKVISHDDAIDEMEIETEEECLHTLALHQPVAFDLRFVVSTLKINNDLERIGDLASNIAEQSIFLASQAELSQPPFNFELMSQKVQSMLKRSLDSLVNLDGDLAISVGDTDDEVDEIHRSVYREVARQIKEGNPQIEQLINYITLSRQLERIADHATNIAEDVLYMIRGEIQRHRHLEMDE